MENTPFNTSSGTAIGLFYLNCIKLFRLLKMQSSTTKSVEQFLTVDFSYVCSLMRAVKFISYVTKWSLKDFLLPTASTYAILSLKVIKLLQVIIKHSQVY